FAVLDARGRVHPYVKPLSLRRAGEFAQQHFPIEALGGMPGVKPLPVGLVLLTEYKAGARWRPRRLTQGQGTLGLLAHVVAARRQPAQSLAALQQIVATAPVLKGRRGEASELAAVILRALSAT